jgi:hypothetical protein
MAGGNSTPWDTSGRKEKYSRAVEGAGIAGEGKVVKALQSRSFVAGSLGREDSFDLMHTNQVKRLRTQEKVAGK